MDSRPKTVAGFPKLRSWIVSCMLAVSVVAAGLPLPAQAATAPPAGQAVVEQRLVDQLGRGGQATFWVVLRQQADLSGAARIRDWNQRGQAVQSRLMATADSSQAGLRRLLQSRNVEYKPFWVIDTIRVRGDRTLLRELAARSEVASIRADVSYEIPAPIPGAQEPTIQTVEWNIDRIRAPLVWSTFGDRGQGITVANIDTGVQFDHPALVNQYRGHQPDGSFDHNYNWFDPAHICGNPSLAPCDNNSHGTHTMGTMVGDDGVNQIGVAPGARWIAAKGCETSSCSLSSLLSSGQWVLAPTDLNGVNPRPDLRPQVVNNSWGGGPGSTDTFYQATVRQWVASGIFPAFANGNSGPGCGSAVPPGSYPESYGVGAFDINNVIASFSSRGPSPFGVNKPNIAGPGVNVRSSVPTNSFAVFSGTSMATPHLAATVALAWSAVPSLVGNIAATRDLLDGSAIPVSDLTCGGTATDNNVWGKGRIDAFNAVANALGPYHRFLLQTGTPISADDAAANYVFATGDFNHDGIDDIYALKVRGTGTGTLEVHVLDGATNYQSFLLETGTPISEADAANFRFAVGDFNRDGIPDLYAFKVSGTGTGTLEVHVLDGATNYQSFLLQTGTPISEADAAANFRFAVGDFNGDGVPDVYGLKVSSTGTGSLEVHVLDGAANYQSFLLETGTPISEADAAANFQFAIGDFNRDGIPDLYGLKVRSTGTGTLEVHVLSGAGGYQSFLLQTGTPISAADAAANFTFATGEFDRDGIPEVYGLKLRSTGTATLETHILSGTP